MMRRYDGKNMAKLKPKPRTRQNKTLSSERTECRFCRERIDHIDYKDLERLQKLITQRGKIFSRKRSGNCAGCQRKAQNAIKRARFMALLPYVS